MRLSRPFFPAPLFFRDAFFRISTTEKTLCLTFDDGPDIRSTIPILQIIERHGIRAIFFCTGSSAESQPELMDRIRSGGHITGNHGYHHLNGFRTPAKRYIENAREADRFTSSRIFRPPYGFITPLQYRLLKSEYKIVFWDVMAYDFDLHFRKERSLRLIRNSIREGSIIVLHDTPHSSSAEILEEFINMAFSADYRFEIPAILNHSS